MRYLLDTHVLIWHFEGSPRLPSKIKEIIVNNKDHIFLCSVSLWEVAIKIGIGKLKLRLPLEKILDLVKKGDYNVLPIKDEYLKRLVVLPSIHKDPFDRLIISTALVENLTIITADDHVRKYDVPSMW